MKLYVLVRSCFFGIIANSFFCSILDEAAAFCLVFYTFSAVTTNASCRWQLNTNDLNNSRWQSGGICQVLSTRDFTLFCHVFDGLIGVLFSLFVTFVLLSCSRVCLLDVSRLLGLTLRHAASVCSCHRDSPTRWRLALAQGAVRVVSSASVQLFF